MKEKPIKASLNQAASTLKEITKQIKSRQASITYRAQQNVENRSIIGRSVDAGHGDTWMRSLVRNNKSPLRKEKRLARKIQGASWTRNQVRRIMAQRAVSKLWQGVSQVKKTSKMKTKKTKSAKVKKAKKAEKTEKAEKAEKAEGLVKDVTDPTIRAQSRSFEKAWQTGRTQKIFGVRVLQAQRQAAANIKGWRPKSKIVKATKPLEPRDPTQKASYRIFMKENHRLQSKIDAASSQGRKNGHRYNSRRRP